MAKRVSYKPGDIFTMRSPSGRVTYGQILLDLHRLWNQTSLFDRYEDCSLASPFCELLIRVFRHKGRRPAIAAFGSLDHFPPFFAFHEQVYRGEFEIIGHVPVSADQIDFPEGTMSHGWPTEYHTFDKGGVSVRIPMNDEEYLLYGGIPGPSMEISPASMAKVVDGNDKATSELYFSDLRFSPQRAEILRRADLTVEMSYRSMAQKTGGILPEDLIAETETLSPGSTSS